MGGRPLALVDTIVSRDPASAAEVARGLMDGCRRYGVALVGGHLTANGASGSVSASILGRARRLLSGAGARPGDFLLHAANLSGSFHPRLAYWSCSSHLSDDELRGDLEILPKLAERGLCSAGRDVSTCGLLGSTLMLLELSGVGAVVDLGAVPEPPEADGRRVEWLLAAPSYGFVLAVAPPKVDSVRRLFGDRNLSCAVFGEVTRGHRVAVRLGDEQSELWNDALGEAQLEADTDLPAVEEAEEKIERLSRQRDSMGPVNLRAETELQELEEQITTMQTEREDLVAAIARLRQGIASLNREGRERLLAAFDVVNKHFEELFVRLFGGGRAHLALTEADDPLEAGLEIMASPPGKKLQIMSLLSGGEQALTALALLFAVFLTNPAPICVLDEVDAPLDDANVDRFCQLLDEIAHAGTTRFLCVTHHRMTMARMDRLFGVTMGERGVSQLVSVDLRRAEELRESA